MTLSDSKSSWPTSPIRTFCYDPESFGVRVGDEVYPEAISDAGGIVGRGKTQPAFFVVAGTSTGGRNDLAVTNKFDVVMRQIIEGEFESVFPTACACERSSDCATRNRQPPACTVRGDRRNVAVGWRLLIEKHRGKRTGTRRKLTEPSGDDIAAQPSKKESSQVTAAEVDDAEVDE